MKLEQYFPAADQIPEAHRLEAKIEQRDYLVDGAISQWSGEQFSVLSPICLQKEKIEQQNIGSYPQCGQEEALTALSAAMKAWDCGRGEWPCMSVEERISAVRRFSTEMTKHRAQVVRLLMWEIGKSYKDSAKEFDRTVQYIEDTIQSLKDLDRNSSRFQMEEGVYAQVRRAPLGVTLCMGPYNYPLNETFATLIPALLMGNPVIFKPARYGVLLLRPLLEAFQSCFPQGVVNTLYGQGQVLISPIMQTGNVDVLALIGSANTSSAILKQHPRPHRLRNVLALNAKNPAIIFDDADLEIAVKECVLGALSFNGQRCTALKLLFVQRAIAERFVTAMADAVSKLKLGMPWDEGVEITPLPEPGKPQKMQALVDDAIHKGAQVVNAEGGQYIATLYKPAVVYPVKSNMRLYQEEQFGPIVPIVPFDDLADVVNYIAESNYGQQASIFSTSPQRIAGLIDPLTNQVCRVNINSQCQRGPDVFPFTGRKDSAEGTLSVSDALKVFSIRTLVAAKSGELNNSILTEILHGRMSSFLSTDFLF